MQQNNFQKRAISFKQCKLLGNVTFSRSAINIQNRIFAWVNNSYHLFGKIRFFSTGGSPPTSRKFSHKAPNTPVDSPLHQIFIPPKRQSPPPPPPKKMNIFKLQPNKNIIFRCWQLCRDSSCRKNTFVLEYYSKYVSHANNSISKDQIFKYKLTSTSTY